MPSLFCIIGFALMLMGAGQAGSSPTSSATCTVQGPVSGMTSSPSTHATRSIESAGTVSVKSKITGTLRSVTTGSIMTKVSSTVVSKPAVTHEPLSAYAEELARIIKFDRQVLLLVREETHERIQRLVGYDGDGYQIVAPGIAVTVPEEKSAAVLTELRKKLRPLDCLAFIVEMNALLKTDKIGVIKGPDPYEILRIMHTDDEENGVFTSDVIEQLKEWEKIASFDIIGADNDWIELEFSRLPGDLKLFGEDVYDFSPDAVDDGPGTIEALLKELRKTKRLFLMWE